MARRKYLVELFVLLLFITEFVNNIEAKKGGGGSRRGSSGSSGWGWGSRSSSKSNNQQSASAPKPSAPQEPHLSKSSASNIHSGYPQSGTGYAGAPPAYSPHQGYNGAPPAYSPHQGYHGAPPAYTPRQGYNPSYSGAAGHGYGAPPAYGHNPYSPNIGQQPQTVILQGQRPGIGQLAKEAFVFAGVSAGVNAAVSRLLPGGIYGHSGGYGNNGYGNSGVGGGTHTQITYNNYYNNATSADSHPVGAAMAAGGVPVTNPSTPAPEGPPTSGDPPPSDNQQNQNNQNPGYLVSHEELKKTTEDLFSKDKNNANNYITMNLQGQKKDESTSDDAPDRLLDVKFEAYELPTVKAVVALHDNYELDVKAKEEVSSTERKEESELLDVFMETEVMKATMVFLSQKGFIPNDEYEFKETLKRIWFSQFKRIDGEPSSSGFETVFLAEKFDNEIIGLHNWIYYAKQEEEKKINYLGYIAKVDLGNKGAIIKVRSSVHDIVQPFTTLFVGTSPELEMALYTICFFTRPNDICPISLGGGNFMIVANRVNYFGKDILIAAFPDL